MNKKLEVKYLIIGAGISGIAFARNCQDDYLILEKTDSVGGYCKTFHVQDYIWDYAGHFYHFKSEKIKNEFLDCYQKDELIFKNKNTKILYKDKLIDYPFQTNIHQLEKEDFIDCLYDLYNRKEKESYSNFVEMLYGKFGNSIVNKFLKPYNEKLYSCDLDLLDIDAMGRFFPYADFSQIINNMKSNVSNSYNNTFLYPKDGAQSFINKMFEKLDKNNIMYNTTASRIDYINKLVYTDGGDVIKYDYLINTAPFNEFSKLIGYTELSNELSYNKVLVFNMGFGAKSKYNEDWIYVPDKEISFYRIGFYNNILSQDKLSIYIELGFKKDDEIDVDFYYHKVIRDLKMMNVITDDAVPECYNFLIMDPAYVHINKKNNEEIQVLKNELEKNNVFSIGRYGAWTYCSMEDCIVMADNLIQKIKDLERRK